jgi:hypothetical protein
MQPIALQPITLGSLIAILVLLVGIVLMIVGQLPIVVGVLICGVALARLV